MLDFHNGARLAATSSRYFAEISVKKTAPEISWPRKARRSRLENKKQWHHNCFSINDDIFLALKILTGGSLPVFSRYC